MPSRIKVGDVFGEWTAAAGQENGSRVWCACSCGRTVKYVDTRNLRQGKSTKCLKCSTLAAGRPGPRKEHFPEVPCKLYQKAYGAAWAAVSRCTNPLNKNYKDYGGRGISVCAEWLADEHNFTRYLLGLPGCEDRNLVLDRIDNNGNYEPGNLRFTTCLESARNRRRKYVRTSALS